MQHKNILILSAGRRVELARAFREQIQINSPASKLFCADINPAYSAACYDADGTIATLRADDGDYVDSLLEFCEQNSIALVIPTIDTELLPLSENRDRFLVRGIHVSVPDKEFVKCCRDKRLSGELFELMGIRYPRIYSKDDVTYPAFAKPISGSSSKGVMKLCSESDLQHVQLANDDVMISEYIGKPFVEYTIDAYYDLHGGLKCLVPRLRIETRAGEVSKGVTRRHTLYNFLIKAAQNLRGCRGCVTIQVFFNELTSEIIGLEINPRFGGGYPLSYAAGANFPAWLICEVLLAERVEFFDAWEADLLMLRYDASVLVRNG